MTLTHSFADTWLARYGQAWEQAAPTGAAELFTEDCRYFETPYAEPAIGRAGVLKYWQRVPDGQADVSFRYRVLAGQAQTVIAHWSASFTRLATRARVDLDGMFLLEFDERGLCSTLREWWHREETPQL